MEIMETQNRFIGLDFGYRPKWGQKVIAFFCRPYRRRWGDYSAMVEWVRHRDGTLEMLSACGFRKRLK
jgi:hypothetical protein